MTGAMNRRRFLGRALATCGGACAWACGGDGPGTAAQATNDAGDGELRVALSDVPMGGVYDAGGGDCAGSAGAIVGRDAGGVYAYTNVCTHQGGHVPAPDSSGISRCCLHGSQFDTNGDLVKGVAPGQASLAHLKVSIEGSGSGAVVVVDTSEIEPDRAARVAAPS